MTDTHFSFSLKRSGLIDRILIPKFYDPDLAEACNVARTDFDLPKLGDLLLPGDEGSALGDWVPKRFYGTGCIPYVRTSDLSAWRIRADFKKGVNETVYRRFKEKQDVRPRDLLMVAHGTYLVGAVAIVTDEDKELVLQDHVFRLRLRSDASVDSFYLLAALSTNFVRRQVRARQFSADIIDKLGDRHLSIRIPIHKKAAIRAQVSELVKSIVDAERSARAALKSLVGDGLLQLRERSVAKLGFAVQRGELTNRILIPKYYDPTVDRTINEAKEFEGGAVTLGKLVEDGKLTINTGIEVGKMAYGTGPVAFIRTSDIVGLEIRRDVRHSVGESFLKTAGDRAGLVAGDILVVRDGTYLVGNSAIVTDDDLPALICGGVFRIRVKDQSLAPYALLAALNLPAVKKQMRSKQFTRDVIDTLGDRVLEVKIPNPDSQWWKSAEKKMRSAFAIKAHVKDATDRSIKLIEPEVPAVASGRPGWSMR